ncbi:MAG: CAP domain-containing protein [Candidatus Binataceae bacterium]
MPTPPRLRRRRALRIGTAIIVVGLIGVISARMHILRTVRIESEQISAPLSAQEFSILKLVNDERARAGLPALQFSPHLMAAARTHSRDMAAHHYFAQRGAAGDSPASRIHAAGLTYRAVAENIYTEQGKNLDSLPQRAVTGWLRSGPRRANLLSPVSRLSAVGIARSSDGTTYVTEDFID